GDPGRAPTPSVPIDSKSISGVVVNSANRSQTAEAGVWVNAETDNLPTHSRRSVVADAQRRFLATDLPEDTHDVWLCGNGARHSKRVKASRGQRVTLQVAKARTAQEAAENYPSNYWLSLYQPPPKHELPPQYTSQDQWIAQMKLGCMLCHQIGAGVTRLWT